MIVRLLSSLGPVGVGLVFVVAAAAKLVAPARTHIHLNQLGMPGWKWLIPVPGILGTGEAILGAALAAGVAPGKVAPATAGLMAALAGVTIWSTSTERTDDCGCYGDLVEVRPWTSVLLNTLYAVLAIVGWRAGRPLLTSTRAQVATVGLVGGAAAPA